MRDDVIVVSVAVRGRQFVQTQSDAEGEGASLCVVIGDFLTVAQMVRLLVQRGKRDKLGSPHNLILFGNKPALAHQRGGGCHEFALAVTFPLSPVRQGRPRTHLAPRYSSLAPCQE